MRFLFHKTKTAAPVNREDAIPPLLYCNVVALSETGPVRDHNEDALDFRYIDGNKADLVAVLADGMGGHAAGEVASRLACASLLDLLTRACLPGPKFLKQAMEITHLEIIKAAKIHEEHKGMGTTAAVIRLKHERLFWAHVGDSRIYHLRNNRLYQLTTDHTLVQQLFEKNEISEHEKNTHPLRNVLLQALGTVPVIQPETGEVTVSGTDKFLICSDGLYEVFTPAELETLLLMNDTKLAVDCMRCLAVERRSSDNFSALVISFDKLAAGIAPITKELNVIQ